MHNKQKKKYKELENYTCPAAQTLKTNGNWYKKSHIELNNTKQIIVKYVN